MAVSLFVGNLPYSASERTLTELFSQVGTVVEVRLPTERDSGRPRGFGFVEMASEQEAQEAIRRFDGYLVDGRTIRVNLAEERAPRSERSGRRTRY